jgi:hypothetical protein
VQSFYQFAREIDDGDVTAISFEQPAEDLGRTSVGSGLASQNRSVVSRRACGLLDPRSMSPQLLV